MRSLGVLRYHIEFAARFVCGIVVPVLAYGIESRFDLASPILPHEVLTADLLEHMWSVVFLEVLGDVTIIEDFRVEQLTRRGIAEDVAIVKERKWVHHKVARLALIRRVVDGCTLLDDFERHELVEYVCHGRTARDVRLCQHVPPTGVTLCESPETRWSLVIFEISALR